MSRASLAASRYSPAMEFAGPVDFNKPILTWRPRDKWIGRIRVGDLIEIEKVHQRQPGRCLARVKAIDHRTEPPPHEAVRLATIYKPGTELICVMLVVEASASKSDPRYVTWATKTTRLGR